MVRKAWSIAIYSLKQWLGDARIRLLFVLLLIFLWNDISVINEFSKYMGINVNPFIFVFYSNDVVKKIIIMAGVIFMFSDVPFFDESHYYVFIRSKRKSWVLGKIIYIIMASGIYFLFLEIASILILIKNAYVSMQSWGKIVNTLSRTNAGSILDLQFGFSDKIISYYTPGEATLISFLINWSVGIVIGLMMFVIALKSNEAISALCATLVVFFDLLVTNALPYKFFYVSPVSLSRLEVIDPLSLTVFPSLKYVMCFFVLTIFVMSIVLMLIINNITIGRENIEG